MQTEVLNWEELFLDYFSSPHVNQDDASHDLGHFRRVYCTARQIASAETQSTDLLVILAAAYFHDIVSLPKNHVDNKMSSRYAAVKAKEILQQMNFPTDKIDPVCHAIEAHSFSAQIEPATLEAKIIQDADRMESLGTLGIMRTFYVTGRIGREPFDPNDLYAKNRPLDDKLFGLDHFYVKLFKLPELLQTQAGRKLAAQRTQFLHDFVQELEANIKRQEGGALLVTSVCCHAGREGLQLFDSRDPMALHRPLIPSDFVIDQLLDAHKHFPAFISVFLSQFQKEIHQTA